MKQHEIMKESWVWNDTVEKFIKIMTLGYSLNVCAGKSSVGDVKVDLDPKDKSILRADMIDLPFANNTFDTVIQDMPWKVGFYHRQKPFFECVRVCKVDGRIINNSYWIPTSKAVVLVSSWIRQDKPWTNTSVISVFKKITDEYDELREHCSNCNRTASEEIEINGKLFWLCDNCITNQAFKEFDANQ